MKKLFIGGIVMFLFLLVIGAASNQENTTRNNELITQNSESSESISDTSTTEVDSSSRSFYLGFTPFPPVISVQGVSDVYSFIAQHADMVTHHLDNGVPWGQSFTNQEYSAHYYEDVARRTRNIPHNHKVYVVITPLNFERDGIASTWGESDNMLTQAPWSDYRLNDENIKTAYLNYARETIKNFNPDYLAIGIEVNMIITKNPLIWNDYLELNRYVYTALKNEYPRLPIFATVQYEFLKGKENDAKPNAELQISGVRELLKHSDYLALSTYRYGLYHNPMTDNYFDLAKSFNKPIAIAEMGVISQDIKIFGTNVQGTEGDQLSFLKEVFRAANSNNFIFITNFVAIDYDEALRQLPSSVSEVAKAWAHTGLQTSQRKSKPALSLWDSYLALPKR
jgi:hypothetical protein